jgi:hypothetical protein
METTLRLLTRDGAIGFQFTPKLEPDQYMALLSAATTADSSDELRSAAETLASQWQIELHVSD